MAFFKSINAFHFSIFLYFSFAILFRTLDITKWSQLNSTALIYIIITAILLSCVSIICERKGITSSKLINNYFEIDNYKSDNIKLLDCILSHYTNVATVGLFLMVFITATDHYIKTIPDNAIPILVAVALVMIFIIYGLFICRLAARFSLIPWIVSFPLILIIFTIDLTAIGIFIKSTP